MFICWSAKGGSGTTVVAAALALVLSRSRPTLLADLHGDAPAALGVPEPAGPGLADWLSSPTADASALQRLALPATARLRLLPRGTSAVEPSGRWSALAAALAACEADVVVDAGTGAPPAALVDAAEHSFLVIRPCYIALRRAVAMNAVSTGIVVVEEPGRVLTGRDIEHALGTPIVAHVPYDPAVARAVDSGMLASRLPRSLIQPLKGAA